MPRNEIKKSDLQIILHDPEGCNIAGLEDSLHSLASMYTAHPASIFCRGGSERAKRLKDMCDKYADVQIVGADNYSCFLDGVNGLAATSGSDYLLFMDAGLTVAEESIAALLNAIRKNPQLSGVSPILVTSDTKKDICHLGSVVDSMGMLHYLYEGISLDNQLAGKSRKFQMPCSNAVLISRKIFLKAGGLDPSLGELALQSLFIKMASICKELYASVPEAIFYTPDRMDSWRVCGLWNSLLARSKISTDLLKPDYYKHVKADGLVYGVTEWLCECPVNLDAAGEGDVGAWYAWRRDPRPSTLLNWLKFLDGGQLGRAISMCRDYPSSLPRAFAWYMHVARHLENFANQNGLTDLRYMIGQWLQKARHFEYSELKPGIRALQTAGIYNASLDNSPAIYDAWVEIEESKSRIKVCRQWPHIAVVMPVWNPKAAFLRQAIASVKKQSYSNWHLCIADDASTDKAIIDILQSEAREDKRIDVVFLEKNQHISCASNEALKLVREPWTAFMDHDDLLAGDALAQVASKISGSDNLYMVYSDEDHIDEFNIRRTPIFRSDFMPYFAGHLACCGTENIRNVGGLRKGLEGSQDFDLYLRISETLKAGQKAHIDKILYHWRVHSQSSAGSIAAKPYVLKATRTALEDAARRAGQSIILHNSAINDVFVPEYRLPPDIAASVILLDSGKCMSAALADCLTQMAEKMCIEICWQPLAKNISRPSLLDRTAAKTLPYSGGHWTDTCVEAAQVAQYDLLLFLDTALEPLPDCKPEQLVFLAQMQGNAAVGGIIWQRGGILHGGIYPDITGLPFPLLKGTPAYLLRSFFWGQFWRTRVVLGISWHCMAMRKEILGNSGISTFKNDIFAETEFGLTQENCGRQMLVSPWGQWNLPVNATSCRPLQNEERIFLEKWKERTSSHGLRNRNMRAAPDFNWTLLL